MVVDLQGKTLGKGEWYVQHFYLVTRLNIK